MARRILGGVLFTAVLAAGAWPGTATAAQDELLDQLQAIPGLTVDQEKPTTTGGRFFTLTFEQPVNHLKPWKGTFKQRVSLYHQGGERPTVMYSGGYGIGSNPFRTEITRIVEGNQLAIEHRFFLPSRPDPADWTDLTIFQEASDDHRLVQAFRAVYHGKWLRTGVSKGGMQATYHTRFYPHDIDGLIAYVAPNDVIDSHDAHIRFLDRVGTDPQCRENLKAFQRQALLRRNEIVPRMIDWTFNDYGRIFETADQALELMVMELPFTFWQYYGVSATCASIPPPDASTDEVFYFLDLVQPISLWTDSIYEPFYMPYFYQAGTQLGYPTVADSHLADLLFYPGQDVPRSFVLREIEMPPLQWWAMPDIDLYVRFFGRHQMFIYGELDPWGAERFQPDPFAADSYTYTVPGGNHLANVAQLPPAQQAAATATIRRWAGLPPLGPAALAAVHDRNRQQVEPDLDQLDRLIRRPR